MKPILFYFIICFFGYATVYASERDTYKYFSVKRLSCIKEIIYSDKKVYNNVILKFSDGKSNLHILCVPFSPFEYEKYLSIRQAEIETKSKQDSCEVQINGRKIVGHKILLDKDHCSVDFTDYFSGISFTFLYFGSSDIDKFLFKTLPGIKYKFSEGDVQKARKSFLHIMQSIDDMNIPNFQGAKNVSREYSLVSLVKVLKYDIDSRNQSKEILNFYIKYFSAMNWIPLEDEYMGNWFNRRLFYTWFDKTGELVARLVLIYEDSENADKLSNVSVYVDVAPYMIMRW